MLEYAGYRPSKGAAKRRRCFPTVRLILRDGTGSSRSTLTFNPRFAEWQMGWPTNWTSCAAPVTGFARWLQRSRTALFEALSNADQ